MGGFDAALINYLSVGRLVSHLSQPRDPEFRGSPLIQL